jgi:sulfate adenylyltransferase
MKVSAPLIAPYGGKLVQLVVEDQEERAALLERAKRLPSVQLSPRTLCDVGCSSPSLLRLPSSA